MTGDTLRVGIVGAGIAGLTAAIALQRSGHQTRVFESSPTLRSAGGALLLWPVAIQQLERLGLARDLRAIATPVYAHEFRTWHGEVVATLPLAELEARHGAPCMLVQRAQLVALLSDTLGSSAVHFDKRASAVRQLGSEVTIEFTDESRARCDLLIGADGIHSAIRPHVQEESKLRSTRRTAWAGIAEGLHPLADCGVAVTLVGSGVMFLYAGLNQAATYWYATLPEDAATDPEALQRSLEDSQEPALELVEATRPTAMFVTPLRDRAPMRPWSRGRVVLIGDSVHACAPDLGQGACQAIESASCLASQLSERASIDEALGAYEDLRFQRCSLLTAASHGALVQTLLEDPRVGPNWSSLARWTAPFTALDLLDWLAGGPRREAGRLSNSVT